MLSRKKIIFRNWWCFIFHRFCTIYCKNDFSKIDKFIKFNNKINRKLKTILLSIIDYYENNNILYKITNEEDTILYLTVLYYLSLKL